MSILRTILPTLAVVSATLSSFAATSAVEEQRDSLMASHRYVYFGEGSNPNSDSIRSLIEHFFYDQFRNFQDPAAPYFLFMSRDANLAMGIGGMVRMRGYFDWGGSVNSPGFSPALIPVSRDPLHDRLLGTTPAGTALFFRVIGRNKSLGTYQLYIEANFNGYSSRDFHLKKAYAILNDWTVGYASSTFSDGSAAPPTIDAAGPNMKMDATAVLVRWMHTFRSHYVVAASVETPSMRIQEDGTTTAARSQYLPNVAAFVQYEWDKEQHVRLAGIVRSLPYRDMLTQKNHTLTGWGVQLSTVFHPAHAWTIYATVNGGKSYSNFGGDILLGRYDLVADPKSPGRLRTTPGFGYNLGVQYNFTPSLFVSTSFGQGRYLPSCDADGTDYKYGLLSTTNIIWYLTPRIQAGAEFSFGKRQDFNGENGYARRIGAMIGFSF
ncbi:MAG: hypothetical protein HDR83_05685 [Bacteroides sp.]|nr:hypothetical protein [Bacteroides sp.]MBD5368730.1 hypothetical protein [Bacteroides sp.]